MLPRKRARPNPAEAQQSQPIPTPVSAKTDPTSLSQASTSPSAARSYSDQMSPPRRATGSNPGTWSGQDEQHAIKKAKSWYASWPAPPKAAASTSVAKEHILGGTVKSNKALDLSRFDSKKADDSASLHSTTSTIRGLPNIPEAKASETVANEDSQQTAPQKPDDEPPSSQDPEPPQEDNKPDAETASDPTTAPQPTPSAGWFGWLARAPVSETKPASTKNNTEMAQKLPPTTTEEPTKEPVEDPPKPLSSEAEQRRPATPPAQTGQEDDVMKDVSSQVAKGAPTASWFGLWRASANPSTTTDPTPVVQSDPAPDQEPEDATMTDAPPPPPSPPHKHEPAPQVGSTWAFWSRDSPKPKGSPTSPESGEIAVMGEVSEAHPKPMEESDVSQSPTKTPETASKPKEIKTGGRSTWRRTRRLRPTSVELDSSSLPSSGTSTPTSTAPQTQDIGQMAPKVDSSNKSITESEIATKLQNNLLLPAFSSTYRMKENPSILKQITQFLLHTQQPPANHVVRVKDPPKIQKAIAIGVHGLFPASYLRPMIGQPTGTSLRFATLCAESIRRWAEDHGCGDCEIEKVALEGEGKIKDRVENLWKLMLNWMEHIRSADLIVIACHSQGVPVSIMLLEKLIDLGIITHAKIGVCAMAGVSMGPFPDIKSSLLMGSAAELWDFANPESDNSKRFEASLKKVLDYGARITFIGSIDDQLVPMESAVYSPANHPYIYRAVFIDGRVHAPDFIAHLIGFALKLRNLGVSDHGLIRELSVSLAGSLYSGAGHSRLYFDDAIYDLAISHALETAPVQNPPPCEITSRQGPLASANPFVLPWIMRGLLEEDFVKTELSAEANELLRQFDDWKPTNKALKDVKYRLEAVRSKL